MAKLNFCSDITLCQLMEPCGNIALQRQNKYKPDFMSVVSVHLA